jgi:hypothetical protein
VVKKKKPLLPQKLRLLKLLPRWKLLRWMPLRWMPLRLLKAKLLLKVKLLPPMLLLRLPLPSNSGSSYEKPAFGPVFLRLQIMPDALDSLAQARKRLGVGKT